MPNINGYYGREIFDQDSENYFFAKENRKADIKHVKELEELAYTYLVECITKSNKELKADFDFANESMSNLWSNAYLELIQVEPYSRYMRERNELVRVINRHKVIEFISGRLLNVVATPYAGNFTKLDCLMAVTDTPIFSVGIEYAENNPRHFPGYARAVDNMDLIEFLDSRYLFSKKGK